MNQLSRFNWQYAAVFLMAIGLLLILIQPSASAQQTEPDIAELMERVDQLEQEVASLRDSARGDLQADRSVLDVADGELAPMSIVIVLYASFCALWAQNKRRNAVLWFILGALFNVFTVLVLLYINWSEREAVI